MSIFFRFIVFSFLLFNLVIVFSADLNEAIVNLEVEMLEEIQQGRRLETQMIRHIETIETGDAMASL